MLTTTTDELVLTEVQRQAMADPIGRRLFLGGPGAGKTTVLGESAVRLISAGIARPDQVLVLAPSRRAAMAIRDYAHRRLGGGLSLTATSFHGLALTILRRHYHEAGYRQPPQVLNTSSQFHVLRTMLGEEDPALWPHHDSGRHSGAMQRLAYDLVTGAKENGLDPEALRRRVQRAGTPELADLVGFAVRYWERQREAGTFDFGEVLSQAVALFAIHPHIADHYRQAYPYLLVDEFEEASFAQAEILYRLVGEQTSLLVAGDPAQAINSYRSGSPAQLKSLADRFGVDAIVSGDNHRAAPPLTRFVRSLTPRETLANRTVQSEETTAAADLLDGDSLADRPKGYVVMRPFAYQTAEARWVAEAVESQMRTGVPPEDIAILFRSLGTPIAKMVIAELRRREIVHHAQSGARVIEDPLVRATIAVLHYLAYRHQDAADRSDQDNTEAERPPNRDLNDAANAKGLREAFLVILLSPLVGLPPFGLSALRRAVARQGRNLSDLHTGELSQLNLSDSLREALTIFRQRLDSFGAKVYWNASSLLWEIWRVFPAFHRDALNGGKSAAAFAVFLNEVVRIEEQRPGFGLEQLVDLLGRGYFEHLTYTGAHQQGVTLTTIHQAKGQDWDLVFLPGLNEGAFPVRRTPLDLRPLLSRDLFREEGPEQTMDAAEINARIEAKHLAEERRVFSVAISRARRGLYLSYGRLGADGTSAVLPSRFLTLVRAFPAVEVVEDDGEGHRPSNVTEATTYYRRLLRERDKLVKAQGLYALAALRQRWPEAVRPEQWWTNIEETMGAAPPFPDGKLYLSASRLGLYRDCPMAFQFSQHWRLGDAGKPAMTMGSVLHAVLQEYHQVGSNLSRSREALEDCLERHFDPSAFPYRPIAQQARQVLSDLLDKYFGRYGQTTGVVATEMKFSFFFGPHKVNGFIDRIDRLPDGALELIDYKSGQAMSKADAETDLQLALYDLAFYHDRELGTLGRPARMSYLYPKNIGPRADGKRSSEPTDESRQRLSAKIGYFAKAILAERFPPHAAIPESLPDLDPSEIERTLRKDPCRFCGWTWLCPQTEREAANGE